MVKNYVHIIFSTKNRVPLIDHSIETELYPYLGGICKRMDCQPLKVGGHMDHIHILCMLSKKITLISFIQELKANSSKWIKTKGDQYEGFYWQEGYGSFSVSPDRTESVVKYIANQHHHHRNVRFKEEYRLILEKYKIEYDERYIWD